MSLDGDLIDLLLSDSEEEGSDSFYASSLSEEEDEDEQSESPLNEDTSSEESDVDSDDNGDGFFLNYREMEESDSSHSSSSSEEEREEEEESYTYYNTFEDPRSPLAAADSPTGSQIEQDSDDEPSPWLRSKAKQRVIKELKDEKSSIHSMKVQDIHQTFAPRYLLARFKQNYKRLLDNLKEERGLFTQIRRSRQKGETEL
mmetsp:Transcript_33834/g.57141  ORF Transcript_33834/g.57141 Transcript_33834/m.57141 type:complete len:201 (-) Transcript_33834:1344-1946(-)